MPWQLVTYVQVLRIRSACQSHPVISAFPAPRRKTVLSGLPSRKGPNPNLCGPLGLPIVTIRCNSISKLKKAPAVITTIPVCAIVAGSFLLHARLISRLFIQFKGRRSWAYVCLNEMDCNGAHDKTRCYQTTSQPGRVSEDCSLFRVLIRGRWYLEPPDLSRTDRIMSDRISL
jgi:hypothetical protein